MVSPIDKVRGEGNCGRATDRREEACECVDKLTNLVVVSRILTSAARLRTETPYKAGSGRRVSTRAPTAGWSAKPFPDTRSGKWRACAATDHVLIRGDLQRSEE